MLLDSELVETELDGERSHPSDFIPFNPKIMPLDADLDSIGRTNEGMAWFDQTMKKLTL